MQKVEAIAILGLEAMATRLEAIASRLEAIASRLEAIDTRLGIPQCPTAWLLLCCDEDG